MKSIMFKYNKYTYFLVLLQLELKVLVIQKINRNLNFQLILKGKY